MAYENILVERTGPVTVVSVNRPKLLNALNGATLRELTQAVRESAESSRALILTGAGEKAFVAGADISEMAPMTPWTAREFSELGHVLTALLEDLPIATIAAVNGYALGGGLELAVGCDMIFASENAKFGLPEVTLGITPGFGGTQRLVRLVGKLRAKEIIFTGEMVDAKRAAEIGLVNHVCPDGEVLDQALACAQRIAKLPQRAAEDTKRILNMHLERAVLATLDFALTAEERSFTSPELRTNIDRLRSRDG
jgi:enoyl-CoA hydratase